MAEKIISKTEFAKLQGVSRETVSRWISRGKLTADCLTPAGKIRVTKAQKALSENLSQHHVRAAAIRDGLTHKEATETAAAAGIAPGVSLNEAQRLWTLYRAALAKLQLDREKDLLVEKSDVVKSAFDCARRTRDALMNVPDRVAAILAAESQEGAVREILNNEIREVLTHLQDQYNEGWDHEEG